ncbi:DUF5105 domain-containing protein [Enterococcus sp. LJL99]
MKKIIMVSVVMVGFLLTGCGSKGISAEDAGELLVDRLIYQKDEDKFAKDFKDGEAVGEELDNNRKQFEGNFKAGLTGTGAEISQKQVDQLTEELLKQVQEKTTYRIAGLDEKKNKVTITYFITGLDLVSAMQEMTRQLIKDALEDPEVTEDEEKTLNMTIDILEERVKAIKIMTDPVELDIVLEKEKGKWVIPNNQKDQIFNLFMAFLSGTKDEKTMEADLEEAFNEVAKEIIENLDNQPIGNKKEDD